MTSQPEPTGYVKEFQTASDWLSSSPAAANLPNEVKLELYGLYKVINASSGPLGSRPSIFAPSSRAKYDSWTVHADKYEHVSDGLDRARNRYVEIAEGIGWSGQGMDGVGEVSEVGDQEDELVDAELEKGTKKAKGGMGTSVSVMAQEEEYGRRPSGLASPIHEAVLDESIKEVRNLLANNPGMVNEVDDFGYTPLHLASDRGYSDLVRVLLDAGANREAKDEDGQTPLMLADVSGREDVASLLRRA